MKTTSWIKKIENYFYVYEILLRIKLICPTFFHLIQTFFWSREEFVWCVEIKYLTFRQLTLILQFAIHPQITFGCIPNV